MSLEWGRAPWGFRLCRFGVEEEEALSGAHFVGDRWSACDPREAVSRKDIARSGGNSPILFPNYLTSNGVSNAPVRSAIAVSSVFGHTWGGPISNLIILATWYVGDKYAPTPLHFPHLYMIFITLLGIPDKKAENPPRPAKVERSGPAGTAGGTPPAITCEISRTSGN